MKLKKTNYLYVKKIAFTLFAILILEESFSQTKLLTMEEAVVKQKTTMAPEKLRQLAWIKGTDKYFYVGKENETDVLIIGKASANIKETALTLKQLNTVLGSRSINYLNAFPQITWKNENEFSFETEKKVLSYNLKTKGLVIESNRDLGNDIENIDVADKTNYVAFTEKNNLYVFDGINKLIVTNDADTNSVNGKVVHQQEFGIKKGTYWSPNGTQLAYYKMDQTMIADYPIIDWTVRPAKVTSIKYPMAGDKSHEVIVGIYNVSNGKTVFIKTGEPKEQYLTNIAWSPDEQHLYITVVNREQNELKLNSYNTASGYFEKTIIEERNEKYVHPTHPIVFLPNKPNQFIWQSERDGFNQLYLYTTDGKLLKQITKGNWLVTDFAGFDTKSKKVFYTSTTESGITRNFYSTEIKSGKTTRITSGDGTHLGMLSSSGNFIIDNFQSTIVPREISIYNTIGKKIQIIKQAENPLKDYQLGEMTLFKLKSENNDDLFCRLYKPVNFDSTKKYPLIVYLYNGPGIQKVNNTWNGDGDYWFQYMAERGYVVFTMDGRGSANRGLAFEQTIFQHLGTLEMKDQMLGIHFLKSQKYIDSTRMGIFGWSFGGFMTTSIMCRYPNVFKVAVAGGPVIDWSYYEIMYTERYMDTPQSNPEGYKEANVLNYVDNLKGKLLLIHGTQDPVVVWQHSLMFLKKAVDKGKQVDYFVYPGHEHNVLGKDREHLYQKVTDYFMQNL